MVLNFCYVEEPSYCHSRKAVSNTAGCGFISSPPPTSTVERSIGQNIFVEESLAQLMALLAEQHASLQHAKHLYLPPAAEQQQSSEICQGRRNQGKVILMGECCQPQGPVVWFCHCRTCQSSEFSSCSLLGAFQHVRLWLHIGDTVRPHIMSVQLVSVWAIWDIHLMHVFRGFQCR